MPQDLTAAPVNLPCKSLSEKSSAADESHQLHWTFTCIYDLVCVENQGRRRLGIPFVELSLTLFNACLWQCILHATSICSAHYFSTPSPPLLSQPSFSAWQRRTPLIIQGGFCFPSERQNVKKPHALLLIALSLHCWPYKRPLSQPPVGSFNGSGSTAPYCPLSLLSRMFALGERTLQANNPEKAACQPIGCPTHTTVRRKLQDKLLPQCACSSEERQ